MLLVPLVVIVASAAWAWSGAAGAQAQDQRLRALRTYLTPPPGWTVAEESSRYSGLFGLCPQSAFDVRDCPSLTVTYQLQQVPADTSELESLLAGRQWEVSEADCSAVPNNVGGRFDTCKIATSEDGFRIALSTNVDAEIGGSTSDPKVLLVVTPE